MLLMVACDLPVGMASAYDPACLLGCVERKGHCNVNISCILPKVVRPPFCSAAASTIFSAFVYYVNHCLHIQFCMHNTTLYRGTRLRLWTMLARGPAGLFFTPQSYTEPSLAPDIIIANAQRDRHGFLQTIIAASDIFADSRPLAAFHLT